MPAAELQAWEEVEYVPDRSGRRPVAIGPRPALPASDGWRDPLTGAKVSGALSPLAGLDIVEITLPKTTMMLDRAEDLERDALAAEREAERLDPGP